MTRFALLALLVLTGCSRHPEPGPQPVPVPTPAPAPNPQPPPESEYDRDIRLCVEAHNKERASRGIPPLKANPQLMASALREAKCCAARGGLSHNCDGSPWSRIREAGYSLGYGGENILYGPDPGETPDVAVGDWMGDVFHRSNVLGKRFTEIGIGYAVRDGYRYWAADYASPAPQGFAAGPEPVVEPRMSAGGRMSSVSSHP